MTKKRGEGGFSYIDVMIAVTILLVGCLTLGAALTTALIRAQDSEEQLQAKQVVTSTLESIFSARDIKDADIQWSKIKNTDDGGIFVSGVQTTVYSGTGVDGILGTADDGLDPDGADDLLGTPDDSVVLEGYSREIKIVSVLDASFTPARDNMRTITVTVYYRSSGALRHESIETQIADYRF